MAIVSAVETTRGMTRVYVDGRELCRLKQSFFKKLPLVEGQAIDENEYLDRLSALQMPSAYEDALTLLDFSARASGDMKKQLIMKGYLEQVADAVVERMKSNRLIDDESFARRMVETAQNKPVGRYALGRKLRAKGAESIAVDQALALIDDDQQRASARILAEKLLRKYAGDDRRQARAKLSQALARRGFSWDVISSALDGLFNGEEWD